MFDLHVISKIWGSVKSFGKLLNFFCFSKINVIFSMVMFFRNTFIIRFSTKMLVVKAGIHKMLIKIANWEDPDQTASSEAV